MNAKFSRPSKRTTIITLISLVLVIVAGLYTWQSLAAWRSYETRLVSEQADYAELKDTALGADSTKKRLEAIRKLDDKLDDRGKLCAMSGLYAWQAMVFPALRDGVKQCEEKVKQLGLVAPPLKALREYLETSQKIQQIVESLKPGEVFSDANWTQKGLEKAKSVSSQLKDLPATGDGAKLKDQANKLSDSLVDTWQTLIQANESKDKDAFLSAAAAITKAYADFMGLADTADTQIKTKVEAVTKVASGL